MKLKESEDYLLASLMSLHYMIKDLELEMKAGKTGPMRKKYRFMLSSFEALRLEFIHEQDMSARFSYDFSRDMALIELGILGKDTINDKIMKCLIAVSMYDFMNYVY